MICSTLRSIRLHSESLYTSYVGVSILDADRDSSLPKAPKYDMVPAIVRLLLEAGTGVTLQDKRGLTALHYAASNHPSVVLEELLQYGADIEAHNVRGSTVVCNALIHNNHSALRLLIDHGVSLNRCNKYGGLLLNYVALYGNIKTMGILQVAHIDNLPMDRVAIDKY